MVHVFTFIGDVVADGLSQDEVKRFETDAGTALQVMAPSSGRFSNGFALGSFTIPPLEDALYQNATVQVMSWTNHLVDLQTMSSAMATITLRRNRENVPLRNLDPPLQFFLPEREDDHLWRGGSQPQLCVLGHHVWEVERTRTGSGTRESHPGVPCVFL